MTYRTFQVVLRLGASLHVGWRRTGNLWQTRPYILANQLLAALAARCAEWKIGGEVGHGPTPYTDKLAWFKNNIRATYLFPTLERDPEKSYLPFYESLGNLIWVRGNEGEKLTCEEFEYFFLDAEMRTALDYNSVTALEGSLYCMEYVRPWTREVETEGRKSSRPVSFAGYLFLSEEAVDKFQEAAEKLGACNIEEILCNLLHCLQVGGERKYGWGLLLASEDSVKECPVLDGLFGRKGISISAAVNGEKGNNGPYVSVVEDEPLLAHVHTKKAECTISGPVEILVQRTTTDGNFFGKEVTLFSCFSPGGRCKNEKSTFKITFEGPWVRVNDAPDQNALEKYEEPCCGDDTS